MFLSTVPRRGSVRPPTLGFPPSYADDSSIKATLVLVISSGESVPNWTLSTRFTGAREKVNLSMANVSSPLPSQSPPRSLPALSP